MILVTGGAGYIGAVFIRQLLEKGYAVRVYDKMYFGLEGLEDVRSNVDIVQGDIREFDAGVLEGTDTVVHLAGLSNDPMAEFNPEANMAINTEGTRKIAEACKQKGVRRMIFASSCSIYDRGLFAEDRIQNEDSEVEPRAAYAVSKYKAERILLDLADDTFHPVILRQGTVYGSSPRMRYDLVVNTFVKCALTSGILNVHCGGEMWRPLIDVRDVGRAYLCCIEAPEEEVGGEIFNISFRNYRVLELAHYVKKALEDLCDVEIEVEYGDTRTRSYRVSTKKMEDRLGFRSIISAEESARDMAEKILAGKHADLHNPRHYNIKWMELLVDMENRLREIGRVF
jgi:nucleoside-diphosphate-sugar epimerase